MVRAAEGPIAVIESPLGRSVSSHKVPHNVWRHLASKGDCVMPLADPLPVWGCNDVTYCNDGKACTINAYDGSGFYALTKTLGNCCGNRECEMGDGSSYPLN